MSLNFENVSFLNSMQVGDVMVGGQPTAEELHNAASRGITTVINLRGLEEPDVKEEQALATQLGMDYVAIPIDGAAGLTLAAARELDVAIASAKGPTIIHCKSGNRVGALFAIRAYEIQGKTAAEALTIGKRNGLTSLEASVANLLGSV